MTLHIQRIVASETMSSRPRLPLQPRNLNTLGSSSSLSSGEQPLSTLESSNNEINKARIMNSSSSLRKGISLVGYPVEVGDEHNASLVTHTGTHTAPLPLSRRTLSGNSGGSGPSAVQSLETIASKDVKARAPLGTSTITQGSTTHSESDQDVIIEEKRKRIDGDGYTIHKYLRGRLLGKGGFAKVYMCTALDTNKQYAVKVVPKANLIKTRARQKLQAEIKIHRTLKHHHICEYKHFFEDRNNCYILLELCHNQSMNELIKRRKRLTEPEAAYFLSQLTEAVQYMHSECVIHRDLKLGNLFLDRNNRIKVGDLGLATRLAHAEEKRQTICGTPNYIAPEVIQGTKETRGHSFEVDIWSMGVILFTILVGKPPYEAKDVKATYKRIIANEYCFPDDAPISAEVKNLIDSMLQSNPANRPTLCGIRNHAFFNMRLPETLPNSILYHTPEWYVDEFGELMIESSDGVSESQNATSGRSLRQPLAARDQNAAPMTVEQEKCGKKKYEIRGALHEHLRSSLLTAPAAKSSNFQIYNENDQRQNTPAAPSPSSPLEDIIARAASLSIAHRKQDPDGLTPGHRHMDDSEVLIFMLETLSTALDVAEARKFTYCHSSGVKATSRGGPVMWVTRYVDYTSKYGLGFLLNDGSSGVYYNDSTKAILAAEGDIFEYIERRKVDTVDGITTKNEPIRETLSLSNAPESLSKKVTLLKHFRNYLIEQQHKSDDTSSEIHITTVVNTVPFVYLKKWIRTKHAILFRLSNQTVQIIFYDQTEILLTPDMRFVTYVDKKRCRSTYFLSDELVGTNTEMAKRLKYSKEILSHLLHGQPPR